MKNALRIIFGVLFILTLYLLPTGIGMLRRVRNVGSIAVVNILLGWTIVGLVVSLAMALRTPDPRGLEYPAFQQHPTQG